MAKLLAALLLMMVAIGPACAVAPTSRADTVAALDRYRTDFAKIRGYGSLSTADRNYVLFSDAMRRVLTEHVKAYDPQVLIDKAEDGLK
jgi:carboxyl-terminal processing protease